MLGFGLLCEWLAAVMMILMGVLVVCVEFIFCGYASFVRGLWCALLGIYLCIVCELLCIQVWQGYAL